MSPVVGAGVGGVEPDGDTVLTQPLDEGEALRAQGPAQPVTLSGHWTGLRAPSAASPAMRWGTVEGGGDSLAAPTPPRDTTDQPTERPTGMTSSASRDLAQPGRYASCWWTRSGRKTDITSRTESTPAAAPCSSTTRCRMRRSCISAAATVTSQLGEAVTTGAVM